MRVIKDGRCTLYAYCDNCDSILEYNQCDIINFFSAKHITCPLCHKDINLDINTLEPYYNQNKIGKEEISKYVTQ